MDTSSDPVVENDSPPAPDKASSRGWNDREGEEDTSKEPSRLPLLLFVLAILSLATIFVYRHTRKPDPTQALAAAEAAVDAQDWKKFEDAMTILMGNEEYASHRVLLAGKALARQGKAEEAMEQLQRLEGHGGPLEAQALCEAGRILMKAGDEVAATGLLKESIQMDETYLLPRKLLVEIYNHWGAQSLEEKQCEKWAELDPDDCAPHVLMGQQAEELGNDQLAMKHFREALKRPMPLDQKHYVQTHLASCLSTQLMIEEAEEVLAEVPDGPKAFVRNIVLANIRLQQGEDAEALVLIDRILPEMGEFDDVVRIDALTIRLRILQAQNRTQRALETARKLIEIDPMNFNARLQMGQILRRLGQEEAAEKEIKEGERIRALRLRFSELHEVAAERPLDPMVRYDLVRHALALGRNDLAGMWMDAARQLDPTGKRRPADLEMPAPPPKPSEKMPSKEDGPPAKKKPDLLDLELPRSK